MKKATTIFLFLIVLLASCKEDQPLTSGQHIILELQEIIAQNNVIEIQVLPINTAGGIWRGFTDFSFHTETIRVGENYYNANRITEYRIRQALDDQNREINVLIIVMDI